MIFADRCFDAQTGAMVFDTFNIDGILGDKLMVNGIIQRVLHVARVATASGGRTSGPSRFLQWIIADLAAPSSDASRSGRSRTTAICFRIRCRCPPSLWASHQRADVIIDFAQYAGKTDLPREPAQYSRTAKAVRPGASSPAAKGT